MKKMVLALSGAMVSAVLMSAPALADTFSFSFSGSNDSGSGFLTANTTSTAGQYLVSSISGTTDGAAITALLAPGTYPIFSSPNDNLLFPGSAPVVDLNGISFVAGGTNYNLFSAGGYGLASGPDEYVNVLNTVTVSRVTPVAATPEPGTLALLGTGALGVVGVVRRRLRAKNAQGGTL